VVPQLTQAELLQQIVDEGASSDDDSAPGFQDGGLATPNLNPVAQNQNYTSENVLEALRSFNQEGNGARFNVLPNLGEAIRQNRPITRPDLTGTEAGFRGTSPVGGGEIGYRLDATLDPLDTGGLVAGADYDLGFTTREREFGLLPPFMEKVLRPTGGGVGIRGAVEGNTADPELSPASQKEIYGNFGLNIPLTGTNIEGSSVTPKDTSTEYDLELNQALGPANFRYKRVFTPGIDDAEEFSVDHPNLEASYSKSPFGTNTLQGGVNVPVGDNTYVSLEGGQQKRKGSPTQKDWAAGINTDVNGTGIGALLRGDSSGDKELEVKVERPGFEISGVKKFNSTESNPRDIREGLRLDASATVPLGRGDLSARGSFERDFGENTLGAGLKYTLGENLSTLAEVERRGNNPTETRVGVRYNLPTDKIPDSLKNLFR
jgi:hypothetical protein